ncbi:MAG: transposase [Snowella sp.]|nr:transposase [Snowella sp.]
MKFDPEKHHRRSIRLKNYDYSQPGYYFLTICTYQRQSWFGEIKNYRMYLNQIGKIVAEEWINTPKIRSNFELDEWIIMPNHLHGIVIINEHILETGEENIKFSGARNAPLRQEPNSISSFVAGFKSAVTKRINLLRNNRDIPIWQRNYYESIIQDEQSLIAIQEYILNNPCQWEKDPDNQENDRSRQALDLDLYC